MYGSLSVAAAVMQQDDVAASHVAGAHGGRFLQHVSTISFGAAARVVAPVVRIDLVADGDVAQILRQLQRANLVGGVGLLIDRIRRAE